MKFNLKNRPKIKKFEKQSQEYPEVINSTIEIPSTDDYEKWFEGFEKELREWLVTLTDFENHYDAGEKRF